MPRSKQESVEPPSARRSVCPLACGLDLFGDRWTLLIVRDLLAGDRRFKDFTGSPEGIPTNILSERLVRLREPRCHRASDPARRLQAPGLSAHGQRRGVAPGPPDDA